MGTSCTDGVKRTMEKYHKKNHEDKCEAKSICSKCGQKLKQNKQ